MRKLALTFTLFLGAILIACDSSEAQFAKMDGSPADISYFREGRSEPPIMKVVYSRPQKKGRTMLGGKEPFGKVWRTGANEATEIKFYRDVKMGDKTIKAGTYSLFTIPNKDKWTIIVSTQLDTWGAYSYDQSQDVARYDVNVQSSDENIEAFSIGFKKVDGGAHMMMGWENTIVEVPFSY
ncbi:MAG: DUF2911 domain-containing protein [Bacteroidota bacterium]